MSQSHLLLLQSRIFQGLPGRYEWNMNPGDSSGNLSSKMFLSIKEGETLPSFQCLKLQRLMRSWMNKVNEEGTACLIGFFWRSSHFSYKAELCGRKWRRIWETAEFSTWLWLRSTDFSEVAAEGRERYNGHFWRRRNAVTGLVIKQKGKIGT